MLAVVAIILLIGGLATVLATTTLTITNASPAHSSTVSSGDVEFSFLVDHNTTGVSCNLTLDDTLVFTQTDVAGGTTVQHTETLSIGTHSWDARCTDGIMENNTGALQFTAADLIGPTITLLSPDDSAASASQDVEFSFSVDDETGIEECTLYIDSITRSTVTTPGIHSATLTLTEGSHTWSVSCTDNASASTSTTSPTRDLSVDLSYPTVTINEPSKWHNTTLETTVFNISADEASDCELLIDSVQEETFSLGAGESARIPVLFDAGTSTYEARCTDSAANTGTASGKVTRHDMQQSDLIIEVDTDKQAYLPGEPVDILVTATEGSIVNLIIRRDSTITYNYTYIHTGGATPPGLFLNTPATYTLEGTATFLELQNTHSSLFMVSNSSQGLLCSIETNQNGYTGVAHAFSGTAYNAFGTVSYSWDFNNDGTADSVGQSTSKTFPSTGIHTVKLTVQDSIDQAQCTSNVQMESTYSLRVIVLNNVTGLVMPNVAVETANKSSDTGSDGIATILLTQGSHFLLVSKTGYNPYMEHIDISANTTKTVRLQQKLADNSAPTITITSPANGATVGGDTVPLVFTVLDQSTAQCIIYFSPYSGWWSVEDDTITLSPSGTGAVSHTHTLSAANFSNGRYHWKVACEDTDSNLAESGNLSFTYNSDAQPTLYTAPSASTSAEFSGIEEVRNVISRLENAIDKVRKLSPEEDEVAELLDIPLDLDGQKTAMVEIQNGYFKTIDPNTFTETDEDINYYNSNFKDQVDSIKHDTMIWADVLQHTTFMKYEFPDDIESILKDYFTFRGEEKSEKELENMVAALNDLQAEMTLSTSAYLVNVTYLSGRQENFTLIKHDITFKNDSLVSAKSVFLEYVPKNIVESAKDMEFISNYQVLNDDPLIRLYPDSKNVIAYYVKAWVDLPLIRDISTIVLEESALDADSGDNKVTGFAVGELIKGRGGKLLLLGLLITLLVAGILLVQGGVLTPDMLSNIPLISRAAGRAEEEESYDEPRSRAESRRRSEPSAVTNLINSVKKRGDHKKALKEVDYLVEDIDEALEMRKHERAKKLYRELTDYYTMIGPDHRRDFKNILGEFSSRLNLSWGEQLLSQAFESIDMGDILKAKSAYKQLTTVYPHLDTECKAQILPKTKKLLARLQSRDMNNALRSLEHAINSSNRQAASRAYAAVQRAYRTLPSNEKKQTFKRISLLRTRMAS